MALSKEIQDKVIQECVKNRYFVNGRFVHKGIDKLFLYFKKCICKRTISRMVKSHFAPFTAVHKRVPKARRKKGGPRGRPAKVNMWVRECIDEIGQSYANQYEKITPQDMLNKLHAKCIDISSTTVYLYFRESLKPEIYGVTFMLVDGSEWDDGRDEYAPPVSPVGNEDLNHCYGSAKIRLWKGVNKPYKSLPAITNFMDQLEDNEDHLSMGSLNTLRYMPLIFKLT